MTLFRRPQSDVRRAVRVVLVDDDPGLRTVLRVLFEQHGFEVVGEAADGVTGVVLVLDHHPDVVITDLQMPVLDGFGLVEALRRSAAELPIVMLTASTDRAVLEEAASSGVTSVVWKGDGLRGVIPAVRAALLGDREREPEVSN